MVKPIKKEVERAPFEENPFKNLKVMIKLIPNVMLKSNPYAKVA